MELEFRAEECSFERTVRDFIAAHWRPPAGITTLPLRPLPPAVQRWFSALADCGWSVPRWPVAHGGTGWTPVEQFIWARETAAAGAPQHCPYAVGVAGPAIIRLGSRAQRERFLPPIRALRDHWYPGYALRGLAPGLAPRVTAERIGTGYRLCGSVPRVPDLPAGSPGNRWMLCLARTGDHAHDVSLVVVDLTEPGVDCGAGEGPGRLSGVTVAPDHLLGTPGGGWRQLELLLSAELESADPAAGLRARLSRLRELIEAFVCAPEDRADFQRRQSELEIDLLGVEMLELRSLAKAQAGQATGPEAAMLALKRGALDTALGELCLEALGYYALPYPAPQHIDNEGSIGHDYALDEIRRWLDGLSRRTDWAASEIHKNVIARVALGG